MTDPRTTYWCRECCRTSGVTSIRHLWSKLTQHAKVLAPIALPGSARYVWGMGACGHTFYRVMSLRNIDRIRERIRWA